MIKIMMMFAIILIIIIMVSLMIYYLIGNYFYNISLSPKTNKTFVLGNQEQSEEEKKWWEEQFNWLESNSHDVYINSTNNGNLKLHAYEIENSNSDVWVIVVHGYMSQGKEMTGFARGFYNRGYNLLILDLRGHGTSEGNYIGMGWHDRLDVIDWIKYILDKNKKSKIILYGISMGASTTIMTTGEKIPDNVKLAIADCGYTCAWDEFAYKLKQLFHMPKFPILYAANSVCKAKANYSLKDASALEQVKKSKTPTLFIHGNLDNFVPFKMLDRLYNIATCEKEKLIIEDANHCFAAIVNPDLYWGTIDKFIGKHI